MERIKSLNNYQKVILIITIAMMVLFSVLYPRTISKVGFLYKDKIFVPRKENGSNVYFGSISGVKASFTVSEDRTVVFQYGTKTYGPYTAKEDPTAIPKDKQLGDYLTGIELRKGNKVLFRGTVVEFGDMSWVYNEDGTVENWKMTYIDSAGNKRDENGNVIDPVEPAVLDILQLMDGPELTHKGEWAFWFLAMFLCVSQVISVLFVDELFRFRMAFKISNAEDAEPSDFEIMGRYIGWTLTTIIAIGFFVRGLML